MGSTQVINRENELTITYYCHISQGLSDQINQYPILRSLHLAISHNNPSYRSANRRLHYDDVKKNATTSQITSLMIIYSTVYSGADQRKHQSSASLAFVRGIHRWLVNSPHKGPLTRKMFPLDYGIIVSDLLICKHVTKRAASVSVGVHCIIIDGRT